MQQRDDHLSVDVVHRDGGRVEATITGMLDLRAVDHLRTELGAVVADDVELVVDLSGVEFLDSSGLRALLAVRQQVADRGGSVALRGQSDRVDRILQITGVRELFADS